MAEPPARGSGPGTGGDRETSGGTVPRPLGAHGRLSRAMSGTGDGRGIGSMYVVFGLGMAASGLSAARHGPRCDEVPEAASDLVGPREHRSRREAAPTGG